MSSFASSNNRSQLGSTLMKPVISAALAGAYFVYVDGRPVSSAFVPSMVIGGATLASGIATGYILPQASGINDPALKSTAQMLTEPLMTGVMTGLVYAPLTGDASLTFNNLLMKGAACDLAASYAAGPIDNLIYSRM
jgi:hypothetical protein